MSEIEETTLPGVGVRHDFMCRSGRRVGVVSHNSGRRELLVYDSRDPDAVKASVELNGDEARTVADLLGGTTVVEHLGQVQQRIEGLAIEWIPLSDSFRPITIGEGEYRKQTGVSIVAIIRGETTIPGPGPDEQLAPGDVLVVVGTAESMERLSDLLGS